MKVNTLRYKTVLYQTFVALFGIPYVLYFSLSSTTFPPEARHTIIVYTVFWGVIMLFYAIYLVWKSINNVNTVQTTEASDPEILRRAFTESMNYPVTLAKVEGSVFLIGAGLIIISLALTSQVDMKKVLFVGFAAAFSTGFIWAMASFIWGSLNVRPVIKLLYSRGFRHNPHEELPGSRASLITWIKLFAPAATFPLFLIALISILTHNYTAAFASFNLLIFSLLLIYLSSSMGITFSKLLRHDIDELIKANSDLAQGDLTTTAIPFSNSELGDLALGVEKVILSLREITEKVRESASKVASTAESMLRAAEKQAAGAQEQASAITEVTTTVEELNRSMEAMNEQSKLLMKLAEEAQPKLIELSDAIEKMLQGFKILKEKSTNSAKRITDLLSKLSEINKILDVLNEIAVQTKILAFNAAIEAVSAGEAGKRFSVVASHIRELATNTSNSAEEIKNLVATIEELSTAAVMSIDEEKKEMESRLSTADKLSEKSNRIMQALQESFEASRRIGVAVAQQKAATQQVAMAMNNISQVTKQSAENAEKIRQSMEELNLLAAELKDLVGRFKLDAEQ